MNNVHLDNETFVKCLIEYLSVLQEGRVKPDNKGANGTIKDSIDNLPDITAVKERLNNIFRLDDDLLKSEQSKIRSNR